MKEAKKNNREGSKEDIIKTKERLSKY